MGFRAQAVCLHVSNQDDVDRICKSTHQLMHGSCLETSRLRVFGGAVNFVVFFFFGGISDTRFQRAHVVWGLWSDARVGRTLPGNVLPRWLILFPLKKTEFGPICLCPSVIRWSWKSPQLIKPETFHWTTWSNSKNNPQNTKGNGWQNRRLMFHHVVSRDAFTISATSRDQDDVWLPSSANPSKAAGSFVRLKPVKTVARMKQVG